MAQAINSCRWRVSLCEGWVKRQSALTLGKIAASDGCAATSAYVKTVWQGLRSALCWGNARMNDRSLHALA